MQIDIVKSLQKMILKFITFTKLIIWHSVRTSRKRIGNVGGRTTTHGYNSADSVRKQYTGYEHDDESKLDFAQARYYNPQHGRFTSVDPLTASASIRDPQTFNRYSYVLNRSYKFTNKLGLMATKPDGIRNSKDVI